jgi:O-methyltransferase involved in polyketide biosynthesis
MFARPNIARIYDYYLGGKDHFEVDRSVAARLAEVQPLVVSGVRANRAFVRRATAFLAELGIAQFIELGSGLPTGDNVHAVAQRVNPDARVVYVDNDPIVLVHGRALLADTHRTVVVEGDIREPERILADRQVRGLIDVEQPVAVLLAAVLHFVTDAEDPGRTVRAFQAVMAPGSALVVSHVVDDGDDMVSAATRESASVYSETTASVALRSREEVGSWFDGFSLVPPGLVDADLWQRAGTGKVTAPIVAGVGVLDQNLSARQKPTTPASRP